jgi:hypothetical protein
MSTLQVNTIETNTPAGVLAVRDVNNALTAIQPSALRGTTANTAPVFQDSAGTLIGTLCRAWVACNGSSTILAAFNVSSVTDNGTGSITANFTNSFANTSYSAVASCQYRGTGSFEALVVTARATSSVSAAAADIVSGAAVEVPYISVAVFA